MQPALKSIDVIIPVFNGEKYLKETILSVLDQTYSPHQIIVIDDGSTDNTPKLVQELQSKNPSIAYYSKKNQGLSSARNYGIQKSRAELVAFVDADDTWEKEKLEKQLAVFLNSELENLGVVYSDFSRIDAQGKKVENCSRFVLDPTVRGDVFKKLHNGNKIAASGSSVLVKRECFSKAGYFDETLSACEDWDMWLKLAQKYAFDFCPEPLVNLRRHPGNMQKDKKLMVYSRLKVYDNWQDAIRFTPWRARYLRRMAIGELMDDFPSFKFYRKLNWGLSRKTRKRLFHNPWATTLIALLVLAEKMPEWGKYSKILKGETKQLIKIIYAKTCR